MTNTSPQPGTEELIPKRSSIVARFQMIVLILIMAGAMATHYVFYRLIDGHVMNTTPFSVSKQFKISFSMTREVMVAITGNAIAIIGSFTLASAIGVAFVQFLWLKLRKGISIRNIKAATECLSNPFAPSA